MDREEKKKAESGAQKRPVHRRRRRPEEASASRKTDGSVPRKPEGASVRRSERSVPRRRAAADGKKRPSAAAEELRKVRRENVGSEKTEKRDGLQAAAAQQKKKPGKTDRGENSRKKSSGRKPGQPGKTGSSRKKRQQKRARFNVISSVVLVAAVCVFVFSLYQLISMLVPYYSGGKIYDEIKDLAITADEDGSGFQVDFDALLKENSDTAAWIRFDEPSIINYPVVKSADNTEYLTKTFAANDNKLGAIFMDMRNSSDFSDRNTFIYGHHLNVGGEMFSGLLEYESESFCKEHPYFYIYTPDGKVRTYTVFSAGVVKDTSDNYKIDYASDAEYEEYLKICQDSSNYKVDVELNAQSQIVSLSTCTNVRDDERFLVQGVLTSTD